MLAIDITEFLANPIRTGIQRVVRELLTHWPTEVEHVVVAFDASIGMLQSVPDAVVRYCIQQSSNPYLSTAEVARNIQAGLSAAERQPVALRRGDRVLIPELFSALQRVRFYRALHKAGIELYAIVHDLLPWTAPHAWNIPYVGGLNDYLSMLMLADERAFTSPAVRDAFYGRLLRKPAADDAVIPLGSDSLKPRQHVAGRPRPYFVCVGTLDGKKGQDKVYRAFLATRARDSMDLVFAGKVPAEPRQEMRAMLAGGEPGIVVVDDPDDDCLAGLVQGAQASVFISQYEGFGLPAVESLYLNTPIIVAADLPALSTLADYGQHRLQQGSDAELTAALDRLAEPTTAAGLRSEIPRLVLQTWHGYAASVARWAMA